MRTTYDQTQVEFEDCGTDLPSYAQRRSISMTCMLQYRPERKNKGTSYEA